MDCKAHPLNPPRVVAIAIDSYLTPTHPFPDPGIPGTHLLRYGQDITWGTGRAAPLGHDVGSSVAVLKPKMEALLGVFASKEKSGMARRLFNLFLAKQGAVTYFDDPSLTTAAAGHPFIQYFCNAALLAPPASPSGKVRIHQALKQANWDIKSLITPRDLGVPAFNDGTDYLTTGDYSNGLGLMINGVQYVYVVATHYHHDKAAKKYCIRLQYRFYDVFGLDDDDLKEKGAMQDGMGNTTAGVGITAWWQLQHQHGYVPLVTRIVLEKEFEAEAI